MFCQSFPKPSILPVVCSKYQYEVVSSRIVGVEEVRYQSEESETAGDDYKFIFVAELLE